MLIVVGAGGHAKVVIATAEAAGVEVAAVVDDDPARHGERLMGVAVAGRVAPVLADPDAQVVLAIGSGRVRQRLAAGLAWGREHLEFELLGLIAAVMGAAWIFLAVAEEVREGETAPFDRAVLLALRTPLRYLLAGVVAIFALALALAVE